jgi:hypothetical protein
LIARRLWRCGSFLFRFFAGFCIIANGAYIGAGSFGRIGDAGTMLRYGSRAWQLWVFGLVATALGLFLWNGLGCEFGFGEAKGRVSRGASIDCLIALLAVVAIELTVRAR